MPWPEGGLETVARCPVCGSERRGLMHADLTDRIFHCAPGTWTLYECAKCSCAYLDPRPTPETIHLAYQHYYTHTSPKKTEDGALHEAHRVRRALINGFCNWRFGTALRPANKLGAMVVSLIPGKRAAIEREYRGLPRLGPRARLLDIGCGNGNFLSLAKTVGWQAYGCDIDPLTVKSVSQQGFDVRQGGVSTFSDMPESFDVITMSHVIEHLHDPQQAIKEIYRLLKPGGRLWIETPNIQSYGYERFGRHWRGLEPPRHFVIFNWNALEEILKKLGFSNIQRLPQYDVYQRQAVKSTAIKRGLDPYAKHPQIRSDRWRGFLINVLTRLHPERSEFITLAARKPLKASGRVQ